jgi:hypothetical protein
MFYYWFLWQFDISGIDINPPIREWKCTQRTKDVFIDSFVHDLGIKDKSTIQQMHEISTLAWEKDKVLRKEKEILNDKQTER